jgi:NTE family protein
MAHGSPPLRPPSYDKKIGLVLQGGGALGSYQAGVYEALASSEYLPDWVAGISIGAIKHCRQYAREPREALAQFLAGNHRPYQPVAVCAR